MKRHRLLSIVAIVAMSMMFVLATTSNGDPSVDITSPEAGSIFFDEDISFTAEVEGDRWWARVRTPECAQGNTNVAGTGGSWNDSTGWQLDNGTLDESINAFDFDAGAYCFVISADDGNEATRVTVSVPFYVVDGYATVSGRVRIDPEVARGNSPTHAFDGLVGTAGTAGPVGSVTINFRELGETCVFTPTHLELDESGLSVSEEDDVMRGTYDSDCGAGNEVSIDLFDAATHDTDRGEIRIRDTDPEYQMPGTVGETGAASLTELERGNVHVGKR